MSDRATVRRVPAEFLADAQAGAYGRFAEEPIRPTLERFFHLEDVGWACFRHKAIQGESPT